MPSSESRESDGFKVVTAGQLNQIEAIIGMLQCRGAANFGTSAAMERHMRIISTPVLWNPETRAVIIPRDAEGVAEFLGLR